MDREAVIVKLLQAEVADHIANVNGHRLRVKMTLFDMQSLIIKCEVITDLLEEMLTELAVP